MATEELMPAVRKSYRYEWYVVTVCMLAYIFSFVDRQVLSLMIEPIKADLHLSDTQFSLLTGLAFSLFYAFMGMPIALLADKRSRPMLIAIGMVFWSLATAMTGLARSFAHIFIARIGVGVGEAALSPAAYSMFSDMFPKSKFGRAVGVYSLGSFIGGAAAFLIGGYVINLVHQIGSVALPFVGAMHAWQLTFVIVGLPGLLVSLLFIFTVRDPRRKGLKLDSNGMVQKVSLKHVGAFLKKHRKTFTAHFLGFSFYAMTLLCLMGWVPAFFIRKFGMSPTEVGYSLGLVVLVANGGGVIFGGWLIDWLAKRGYADAPMRQGVIGAAAMILPVILFTQVSQLWLSLALLVVAMFFASFPMPASTVAMQILSPNQMRAQISAAFLLVSNLIGLAIGTTAIALVTDRVFKDPLLVGSSISVVLGIASVLALLLLWRGCRYYRESLTRETMTAHAIEAAVPVR